MNEPVDPAEGIRVRVTDLKSSDALMFEDNEGQPVLLIARRQSFASAVDSVQRTMEISEEQAREIVRAHHPEAVEWGEQDIELLNDVARPNGVASPRRDSTAQKKAAERTRLRIVPRWAITAIAAVTALGIGYGMPHRPTAPVHAAPRGVHERTAETADVQPYSSASFKEFATDGEMACTPTGPLKARCVDVDGKVMASEASIGSDWTSFAFTYDDSKNRIELRVFASEAAARQWTSTESTKASMPNLTQVDRYALWGTDARRLDEYLRLLKDQDADGASVLSSAQNQPTQYGEHQADQSTGVAATYVARPVQPATANLAEQEQEQRTPALIPAAYGVDDRPDTAPDPAIDAPATPAPRAENQQPMPRRLAALALGTLNVSPNNWPTLQQASSLRDMGAVVAVAIIMGVDPASTGIPVADLPVTVMTKRSATDAAVPNVPAPDVPEQGRAAGAPLHDDPVEPLAQPVAEPLPLPTTHVDPVPTPPVEDKPPVTPPPVVIEPAEPPVAEPPVVEPPVVEPPVVEPQVAEPPVDEPREGDAADPGDAVQDARQTPLEDGAVATQPTSDAAAQQDPEPTPGP
uniref:hypothetical protein n=1 Tax=Streptomyces sp. CA-136453 TaxID=3240050 RepID=UPI003F49A75B